MTNKFNKKEYLSNDFIYNTVYLLITDEIDKPFIAVRPFNSVRVGNSAHHDAQLSKFS